MKINEKEAGDGPFFKKTLMRTLTYKGVYVFTQKPKVGLVTSCKVRMIIL